MPNEEEKQALIHECVMLKGLLDNAEKKYKEAKAALKTLMEEDGDAFVESEDGKAFYKGGSATYLGDAATVARLLNKDELVDLVAGAKLAQKDANFLTQVTSGRNISSLFNQTPLRSFTVERSRTKAEKERIQKAIDAQAEGEMKELTERVNQFRKRLGLDRSERLESPRGSAATYGGKGRKKAAKKKSRKG